MAPVYGAVSSWPPKYGRRRLSRGLGERCRGRGSGEQERGGNAPIQHRTASNRERVNNKLR